MGLGTEDHPPWGGVKFVGAKKVNRMKGAPPHLLMVPYPAQPHILPMLSLARQIEALGGITITFVSHERLIDRLVKTESNLDGTIHFVGVPDHLPGFDPPKDIPVNPVVLRESCELGHCMGPLVDKLLQDQDSLQGPTWLISDWINWWTIGFVNWISSIENKLDYSIYVQKEEKDYAAKLGIPRYIFCASSAATVLQHAYQPKDGFEFAEGEWKKLPGFPAVQIRHMIKNVLKDDPSMKAFRDRFCPSLLESDGMLVNTSLSLESEVIDAVQATLPPGRPVLPVGPLGLAPGVFRSGVSMEGLKLSDESLVINWLNGQPPVSVLYVSFGTTGVFNFHKRHVKELAKGLEASGQRFLWVFRPPPGVDENDPELLPPGFEERVKERGLLLREWAPQLKILAHPSTGAFLSSCGWNSSLESLGLGVPTIGWPSFADQPITCRLMEMTLKVAITLPCGADYFVKAEDFTKAINTTLQTEGGTALRERARKYKPQIAADLAPGGSSSQGIREFADMVRRGPLPTESYSST